MSISKISRSLVVALFVVLISFLGIIDVVYIRNNQEISGPSNLVKLGYIALVIILTSLYTYVREKLSRLKLDRNLSTLYKYTYIILVMFATTFFRVYGTLGEYPKTTLLLYFMLSYLIGFFTQRIIFNISKSDVLSVFGMFVAFTLPNVVEDRIMNLNSKFIALAIVVCIYVIQTLIDELKQLNIKNKKYIKQALVLGICVGLSTLVGVSYLIWIGVAILSLFITSNLDSTSLNLSNRPNSTIKRKKNNYFIYKIERIKISKLIVSIVIVTIMTTLIYTGGKLLLNFLTERANGVSTNITNNLLIGIHSDENISFSNIKNVAFSLVGLSTRFNIVCIVYIVLMEVLAVILRRKYDTKSTIIKMMFIGMYTLVTLFKLNILYYQPAFTMLLVIVCIVNTTNIYYNREERIKMIEA